MPHLNAHCHLELSHLKGAIPPGLPFVSWLEKIVALKRAANPADLETAARAALCRVVETGTAALLDIDSLGITPGIVRSQDAALSQLQSLTIFRELIRFEPAGARAFVETEAVGVPRKIGRVDYGLSPHAPYTTSEELLRAAAKAAAQDRRWLCIHAAETPEENMMLTHGTGSLHDFLRPFLPADWTPPGARAIQLLDRNNCLGASTLLVHCNDVTDAEIDLIAARGASVVVCPGTHVYFRRVDFPLERLLRAGVRVYLGTDSLASNEDLDMAREINLACELSPTVARERIEALTNPDRFFAAG